MAKSSSNTKAKINPKGLGIFALASIVVSSMLGGGIYSLPQNMAAALPPELFCLPGSLQASAFILLSTRFLSCLWLSRS